MTVRRRCSRRAAAIFMPLGVTIIQTRSRCCKNSAKSPPTRASRGRFCCRAVLEVKCRVFDRLRLRASVWPLQRRLLHAGAQSERAAYYNSKQICLGAPNARFRDGQVILDRRARYILPLVPPNPRLSEDGSRYIVHNRPGTDLVCARPVRQLTSVPIMKVL